MSPTRLSSDLLTLLDSAIAEAKRAGAQSATAVHVAVAIARGHPGAVDEVLGDGSAVRLCQNSVAELSKGAPTARDLLEQAPSAAPEELIEIVAGSVPGLRDWLAKPAAPEPEQAEVEAATDSRSYRYLLPVEPNDSIVGVDELVDEILALISRREPATPLIVGAAGSGKTALLEALALRLSRGDTPLGETAVLRLGVDSVLCDNPIQVLDAALDSATNGEIVAIDDVDVALALGTGGAIGPMLTRLRAAVESPTIRLILIADLKFVDRLGVVDEELAGELTRVDVTPLNAQVLQGLADRVAAELAAHHGVTIPRECAWLAAAPPSRTDARTQPGLLVDRLDAACARARLRPDLTVLDSDLGITHDASVSPLDAEAVGAALRERVRGQDAAVDGVAAHLALTRAKLDRYPERPDGVFLLVGPTGVGKTELARALAAYLFDSDDRLIRLDMSEYAGEWALSRIIGPQPGYVGFTQPESWLTTRVIAQPEAVVLLDEIEKAHPVVWNAFLQVFDAGRLTDSRGNVADFSRTIVLLTSNIGATTFGRSQLGFGAVSAEEDTRAVEVADVRRAVEQTMPPELINRLDGIIVFSPLGDDVLLEIAEVELERLTARLAERGYRIRFEDGVARYIAGVNRDPRYGARHLLRNIDKLLLEPLAALKYRELTVRVEGDSIVWTEVHDQT